MYIPHSGYDVGGRKETKKSKTELNNAKNEQRGDERGKKRRRRIRGYQRRTLAAKSKPTLVWILSRGSETTFQAWPGGLVWWVSGTAVPRLHYIHYAQSLSEWWHVHVQRGDIQTWNTYKTHKYLSKTHWITDVCQKDRMSWGVLSVSDNCCGLFSGSADPTLKRGFVLYTPHQSHWIGFGVFKSNSLPPARHTMGDNCIH